MLKTAKKAKIPNNYFTYMTFCLVWWYLYGNKINK